LSKVYSKKIGPGPDGSSEAFRNLGVDVGLWLEQERDRLRQRAA
jgi:hypothetical protein